MMRPFGIRSVCGPLLSLLLSLAPLFITSGRALAQTYVVAHASIAFPFQAGTETFAAGDYTIDSSVPSFIFIRSKDGKHYAEAPTVLFGEPVDKSEAKLIFVKRDGKYVLDVLWGVLGKRRITSELASTSNGAKETREVPLKY
ncbi:MAG TPA: hypothetical protein VK699_00015 [Terriglobales bacterium]|nr:hypothetical protein [Terriglobales bacterium]